MLKWIRDNRDIQVMLLIIVSIFSTFFFFMTKQQHRFIEVESDTYIELTQYRTKLLLCAEGINCERMDILPIDLKYLNHLKSQARFYLDLILYLKRIIYLNMTMILLGNILLTFMKKLKKRLKRIRGTKLRKI